MQPIRCKIDNIEAVSAAVSKVTLVPETEMTFSAGQYLRVIMGVKDARPFSIANAPRKDRLLELHIGAGPENNYASEVLQVMSEEGEVSVDGGHGDAFLRENHILPMILLAGGTGFSYALSILQRRLELKSKEPVFLYWGAQQTQDIYAYEYLMDLQKQHKYFRFIPVVEKTQGIWQGKTGLVHQAVMQDFVSLEPYQVYIAGPFAMAGVAREDFHNKGLLLSNLYGDAYQFI